MTIQVRDVVKVLEELAPSLLAESWDNVGLLLGDPAQQVRTVLVALDVTPAVLRQAAEQGAQLLLTHHPLIFSPVKRLLEDGGTSTLIRQLIREDRSLISLHTNLDSAPRGLNSYVAELLGLQAHRPLLPATAGALLKLVVYIPQTHVEVVREAICAAGAGHIGRYSECTFATAGEGTFLPEEGTQPFIGSSGQLARVEEARLETVVPKASLGAVLAALTASHPYEEVAYDLFTLENAWPGTGLGRIGKLPHPMPLAELLALVRDVLHTNHLSFTGNSTQMVSTLALCTGAGGDFIPQAQQAGADCYLTGEVKHHQALLARQQRMAIIDAGHFATERPAVPLLANYLSKRLPELHIVRAEEEEPFFEG